MSDTKTWKELLAAEKQKDYFQEILNVIKSQRESGKVIFPANSDMFNAFKFTEFNDVKVVIIGQDPYHGVGQAHGLSFSVLDGVSKPPSLINIFKEIESDLGLKAPQSGNLTYLAKQGVFLLNACLSVVKDTPGSHSKLGWQIFTDEVIKILSAEKENLVFLLWGAYAINKKDLISDKHLILTAPHPSPLSAHRGFLGCKHFSKTNEYLNDKKINWVG